MVYYYGDLLPDPYSDEGKALTKSAPPDASLPKKGAFPNSAKAFFQKFINPVLEQQKRHVIPRRKSVNRVASKPQERTVTITAENLYIPIIYGRVETGFKIFAVGKIGTDLVLGGLVCVGEIDAYESITVNDQPLPSEITVTKYYGTTSQAVDPTLQQAISGYNDDLVVTIDGVDVGIAYCVFRIPPNVVKDWPTFKAVVRGRKVSDLNDPPSVAYSDNPVHCFADWYQNSQFGAGGTIDTASFQAAASACDELVGSSEKRRTIGLEMDKVAPISTWLEVWKAYIGCLYSYNENGLVLVPNRPRATDHTIDHSSGQLAQNPRLQKLDTAEVPTVVKVVYTDTSGNPWREGVAVAELSGVSSGTVPRRESVIRLPGITRYSQARREAIERLNALTLCDLKTELYVFDEGLKVTAGDVIEVTHPVGLTNKPMRVLDAQVIAPGRWKLTCIEYDPAVYSDEVATAPTYPDFQQNNGIQVDWSTQVVGSGKPEDGATANRIFRQSTAPAGTNGDLWYDTSNYLLYRHNGSDWELIGNAYDATSLLNDDAGLGQKAVWSFITGTGKPEDNATVGATWKQNIIDQPSDYELLNAIQLREGCEDTSVWSLTNSTIALETSDRYSGTSSVKITWTGTTNPASSGTTNSAYITVPTPIALGFGGKRIRVSLYAKQPSSNASSQFAVAYSTSDVGNSGWHYFTPTTSWAKYSFTYDVPTPNTGGTDYLGIWADTSHSGKSILIDNIVIEAIVAEDELDALSLNNGPAEAGATNDSSWRHPSNPNYFNAQYQKGNWVTKTSSFTASVNTQYRIDTSGGSITMTLPANPSESDWVQWIDLASNFGINHLTIARNGQKIMGLAEDLICDKDYQNGILEYTGSTYGWVLL